MRIKWNQDVTLESDSIDNDSKSISETSLVFDAGEECCVEICDEYSNAVDLKFNDDDSIVFAVPKAWFTVVN